MFSCVFVNFPRLCPGSGRVVLIVSIRDHCLLPYIYRENTRPTALIFGIVVLYQVCSYHGSVAKKAHLSGHTCIVRTNNLLCII